MSLIGQPMPEISGVSKLLWTAGHPVVYELELETCHSQVNQLYGNPEKVILFTYSHLATMMTKSNPWGIQEGG